MADMMSTLRGMLGDGADEKIRSAMEILKSGELTKEDNRETVPIESPNTNGMNFTPESLEMISQIKGIFDKISTTNDSRSELLRSLRPFVRGERQKSIDKAIRLINLGRFSGLIGR